MFDLMNRESVLDAFYNENATVGDLTVQDPENDVLIAESLFTSNLSSEELAALCEDSSQMAQLVDEGILSEKSIVKFDKKAKLSRAESQAVLIIAREKKDRDFNKLIRVWKMRKFLLEKLTKKYGTQAKARAKQMVKNMGKSKSQTAKKVAKKSV